MDRLDLRHSTDKQTDVAARTPVQGTRARAQAVRGRADLRHVHAAPAAARDYEKLPASSDSPSVLSGHRPDDAPAARGVGLLEATTPTIGWPNWS
ncbi:hypothetical protein GCM10009527_092070 [Actinomadura nitritigenes]